MRILVANKEEAYKEFRKIHGIPRDRLEFILSTGWDLGQKLCDRWSSAALRAVLIWVMVLRKPEPEGTRRVPHRRIFTTDGVPPCSLAT